MSQYLCFFLKDGDRFVQIGEFTRSTNMYELFDLYAPDGKIRNLTTAQFYKICNNAEEMIIKIKKTIERKNADIDFLKTSKDSLDERLEKVNEILNEIEELNDIIDEYDHAITILQVYVYNVDGSFDEMTTSIYYGIEIYKPTEEDVV